jgi:hypothetical protein
MSPGLNELPVADQTKLEIKPSSTTYQFRAGEVQLEVSFVGNARIDSPENLSRTDSSISFEVKSLDGKSHKVQLYMDCSGELVVNDPSQNVEWGRLYLGQYLVQSMWRSGGTPLNRVGDDHRIDWGRLYLGGSSNIQRLGSSEDIRREFAETGSLGRNDDFRQPRPVWDAWPVMAIARTNLDVSKEESQSGFFTLGYDDDFAIEYFRRPLRAAWRTGESSAVEEWFSQSWGGAAGADDEALIKDWKLYGQNFVYLATLAYRQCLAGHKIVRDIDGTLLMFGKENFSNGCIGTVDVMYPACPIFLAYNPALLKANMEPIMQYASMPRWKWKFAPHDLGTYPKANGQVYGGGEKTEENQMPVEESGNMLIMAAAYLEKSGDKAWIEKYWSKFTEWAEYLKQYGVDPGNQLCTDDFAGHLAHNANLSIKAIVAMACYGKMCGVLGHEKDKTYWTDMSHKFARDWMKMADDGDHYRLAFDKPGTWSQKYNLVWDKVLKLGLFPQEVYDKEVAYYLTKINKYGRPLDNRADYTKLDWTVWTACLASKKEDFEKIMAPVYKWMNETPDRIPLTDWYDTKTARCIGFRARTVVGGVFMPLLSGSPSPVHGGGG